MPTMTRSHFQLLADAISTATTAALENASDNVEYRDGMRYMRSAILNEIAHALHRTNPNFDEDKFRQACLSR